MRNIFKVEKKETIVLPSGVKAEIRGLEGKHQELITTQDEKKRMQGLKTMLWDSIIQLGESNSIQESYVDKLTSFDRKYLLWRLRKLSNEDKPTFVFDYEFPVKNGVKHKERFEVEFNDEAFPTRPAKWVTDFEIETEEQKAKQIPGEFPVVYDTYDEMLENHYEKYYTLPQCKVEVFWHLATGEDEDKLSKIAGYQNTSNTQFHMRTPKYNDPELSKEKGKPVIQAVPLHNLCNEDIEALRRDIMETEGSVDSMCVVQSTKDSSLVTQLDLLQTPAFFFASLAL